jgi:chromosome segregation ATPase
MAFRDQIAHIRGQLSELEAAYSRRREELVKEVPGNINVELDNLKKENARLKAEVDTHKADKTRLTQEIEGLKAQVRDIDKAKKDHSDILDREIVNLRVERDRLQRTLTDTRRQLSDMQKRYILSCSECEGLRRQLQTSKV